MISQQVMAVQTAVAPPGVGDKMDTIGGWIAWAAGWGGGIGFIVVGATFMYAHYAGHGSSKAVSALFNTMIGCAIVAAAGVLSTALLT